MENPAPPHCQGSEDCDTSGSSQLLKMHVMVLITVFIPITLALARWSVCQQPHAYRSPSASAQVLYRIGTHWCSWAGQDMTDNPQTECRLIFWDDFVWIHMWLSHSWVVCGFAKQTCLYVHHLWEIHVYCNSVRKENEGPWKMEGDMKQMFIARKRTGESVVHHWRRNPSGPRAAPGRFNLKDTLDN